MMISEDLAMELDYSLVHMKGGMETIHRTWLTMGYGSGGMVLDDLHSLHAILMLCCDAVRQRDETRDVDHRLDR